MSELNIPDYRLRVNLGSAEGTVLPYHYRQYVTGFIYKTLDNISPDKGKILHDRGYFEDNRYKFFTHGLVLLNQDSVKMACPVSPIAGCYGFLLLIVNCLV